MKTEKTEKTEAPIPTRPTGSITLTKTGADWILKKLAADGHDPAIYALCLSVRAGGCSGYEYDMRLAEPEPERVIIEKSGARLAVDARSLELLNGAMVSYADRLQGAGFIVINPNAKGTCGCGTSFSV